MRIGLFQYDILPDRNANIDKIEKALQNIGKLDLLLLPELCLTGYATDPATIANVEGDDQLLRLQQTAKANKTLIVGGFCIAEHHRYYNRALFISGEGLTARYDKQKLFTVWDEDKRFHPGAVSLRVDLQDWWITGCICYELRFPELFRTTVGAQLILVIANWPEERRDHWLTLLKARAIENQAYVAGVNRVGNFKNIHFVGDSVIYDPRGKELLNLGEKEICSVINIDLEPLERYRDKFPVIRSLVKK